MMILKEVSGYCAFDALIRQDFNFCMYRYPGEGTLHFVMQKGGDPEYFPDLKALNGKNGFVFAPFKVSEKTPVVLVRPDIHLEGEKNILNFISEQKGISLDFASGKAIDLPSIFRYYDRQVYQKSFELFHEALRSNYCEKIVLSRPFSLSSPSGFSAGKTFQTACKKYPEAFVYLFHSPKTGTWLGSSPELILSGKEEEWQTVALAGTKEISHENETPEWDEKNITEQHIVTDYLEKQLGMHHLTCSKKGPFASKAGKLMHLKTEICFRMKDHNHIGDLLDTLHPTPAVCGYPKEEAYRLVTEKEGYDRAYYSGFTGPLFMEGETGLYVNLRCMKVDTDRLTLFAGGGLLASSDAQSEWEETEAKLQTMLSLIKQ